MSQDIVLGSTLQFKSIVKGTLPLFVKWFKDNRELKPGTRCSIWNEETTHFFELISTKITDAGVYNCQLANEAGSVISTANVFIKGLQFLLISLVNKFCVTFLTLLLILSFLTLKDE